MVTTLELQRRGLRYAVVVDGAATPASLQALDRQGLPYLVEVADGATMASRRALEARGLRYLVPVLVDATPASKASLAAQGLRYAVQVDADILPADRLVLQRQGLACYVEVDSSGNSVSAVTDAGGALLLTGEANGFATDFTHAVDAERVAVKTSNVVTYSTIDGFFTQAGTSPKMVYNVAGALVWSPHNFIEQSKDASTVSLTSGVTVTVNTTAGPLGDLTADTLAFTPNSYHYKASTVASNVGIVYCGSVWLKSAAPVTIGMRINDGAAAQSTLASVTTSWQQFSVAFTSTLSNTMLLGLDPRALTGDDNLAKTVIAADWQINIGATPTTYLPATTAASIGLALDYDPVTHAARGLWSEPAATNLIIQSAAPATQGVTVTATAYTLSFFGTGTLTLTGVSTAGPLVGTGANNRVSLTFTPTAGTLTLTKSGTVTNAQLETGSVATSVIPTLAATVTRAADQYNVTPASIGHSATAGSWWAEWSARSVVANGRIIGNTSASAPLLMGSNSVGILDGTTLSKSLTWAVDTTHRAASAYASGDRAVTLNGAAVAADAGATTNLLAPGAAIYLGNGASTPMNGYLRKVRYLPRRPTNSELVTMTT